MADANELQETSIPDEETVQETETETTDSKSTPTV
jgi:hypothetical protein